MTDARRTLVLLRHAKSDYPDDVADHDRPLAPRGEREATLAGEWLREGAGLQPPVQAVLCSSATRTRQTLQRTGLTVPTHVTERLYGATPGTVIAEVNAAATRFDFDPQTLLVVGHEPAMSQVAVGLADAAESNLAAAERISSKYPTSALAVLRFEGPWSALELGTAALVTFYVPR